MIFNDLYKWLIENDMINRAGAAMQALIGLTNNFHFFARHSQIFNQIRQLYESIIPQKV